MTPVVDIIFDGKDSNINNWFSRDKVLRIIHGPNVVKDTTFNYWKIDGHAEIKRHFFINLSYGGCANDPGMICVLDQ